MEKRKKENKNRLAAILLAKTITYLIDNLKLKLPNNNKNNLIYLQA